jgi:hypothetical protein
MQDIYNRLLHRAEVSSDINEHMMTLAGFSMMCDHITEMGVRDVVSTYAFLAAKPKKLVCIDVFYSRNIEDAIELGDKNGIEVEFLQQDTIQPGFDIEQTDFLFIDTWHVYPQLKQELKQHAHKVNKFIGFHDTVTFGEKNEGDYESDPKGLNAAINEFLQENQEWVKCYDYKHNNGLTILKRK